MKYISFILDDVGLDNIIEEGGIQDNMGNALARFQVRNHDFLPDLTNPVGGMARFLYKSESRLIGENISINYDPDSDAISYHIVSLDGKFLLGRMVISDKESDLVYLKLKADSMVMKEIYDHQGYMDKGVKHYLTARNDACKYLNVAGIEPIRLHDKADDDEQERLRQFYETCIY